MKHNDPKHNAREAMDDALYRNHLENVKLFVLLFGFPNYDTETPPDEGNE